MSLKSDQLEILLVLYLSPSLRYFAGISLIKIRKFDKIDTMCLILLKSTISEKNEDVECIVMRNFFLKL